MKKKILVPIMAIAMIVTAGVNYKMISNSEMSSNTSLSMLVKNAFAINGEDGDSGYTCYPTGDAWTDPCTYDQSSTATSTSVGTNGVVIVTVTVTTTTVNGTYEYCDCANEDSYDSCPCS